MTIEEIKAYFFSNFKDLTLLENDDDLFFMHKNNEKLPFVTLVTKDNDYDNVSNLNRDRFFRMNFAIDKETFLSKFEGLTDNKKLEAYMNLDIDFTQQDVIMPHPTYGTMNWVCIVNPSKGSFELIKEHLQTTYRKL